MATKEQVDALLRHGLDYADAGRELGVPAGQAYLTATGLPADGAATLTRAPRADRMVRGSRAQVLVNPREVSPTTRGDVLAWIRRRAFMDATMRTPAGKEAAKPAAKHAGKEVANEVPNHAAKHATKDGGKDPRRDTA